MTAKGNGLFREIKSPAQVRIPLVFPGANHNFFDTDAIWDTGATNTVIDAKLVAQMQLTATGKSIVNHAQGSTRANTYIVDVLLPMGVGFQNVIVTEGQLGGCGLLIGMDIITTGDFALTRDGNTSWFSFRVPPSGQGVDYVDQINAQKAKQALRRQKSKFWVPPANFKKRGGKKKR